MTKTEYICFHLCCILKLQKNERAKELIDKNVNSLSSELIDNFYLAVTGRIKDKRENSLKLEHLYEMVFDETFTQELTPSQLARLWQGRFEHGKLFAGYTERDDYRDEKFIVGQHIYALVPASDCKTPDYFFDASEFDKIKTGTAMDAYALLQLDPYWTGGYGARTIINEYEVVHEFIGAKGYALNNHHLSRETTSDEPLTKDEKIERGIGKNHIECDPRDEDFYEYEYILPPVGQIFVPEKNKGDIKLYEKKVYQLKDDMQNYKKIYEEAVIKAQNSRLKHLFYLYEQNKRFNDLP